MMAGMGQGGADRRGKKARGRKKGTDEDFGGMGGLGGMFGNMFGTECFEPPHNRCWCCYSCA